MIDFPSSQFIINGYSVSYRFGRNCNLGGVLIYARENKWLMCGTYHAPSQNDQTYYDNPGEALDIYNEIFSQFVLIGYFNAQDTEPILTEFLCQ